MAVSAILLTIDTTQTFWFEFDILEGSPADILILS